MFHAALLHLMLVAASTRTTFTISLKRSTPHLPQRLAEYPI